MSYDLIIHHQKAYRMATAIASHAGDASKVAKLQMQILRIGLAVLISAIKTDTNE
ncbi:MAG: hypothetical protein HFE76_00105 [Firmicutes bacterium]|nr:hypothetical protein [Bacillota bacterium]